MNEKISKSLNKVVSDYKANKFNADNKKEAIYIKIDSDVLKWFKAEGAGYQVRMNEVLKRFVLEVTGDDNFNKKKNILAQKLYEKYYTQCFWHMKPNLIITDEYMLAIIEGLRKYGGREGFLEAEKLCQ